MNYFENSEESKTASRLVLGTAQLGMPYGIANSTGQPDFETAVAIIKTAWECGIREFDTAQAYGESEAVLGRALSSLGIANDVRIITKLDPKLDPHQGQDIKRAVDRSLERLQLPCLFGLMLHREEWLDDLNKGLEKTLQTLVLDGWRSASRRFPVYTSNGLAGIEIRYLGYDSGAGQYIRPSVCRCRCF